MDFVTHLFSKKRFFFSRLLLQCNFNQELSVRQKNCIGVETRNACFSKLLKIQHHDKFMLELGGILHMYTCTHVHKHD